MAKQNNTTFWIIGGILVVLLLGFQLGLFVITGQETVIREFPNEVDAGTNQGIKYVVKGASGKWGVSIIDALSCPGYSGISKKTVIISDAGSSLIVFYQLPDKGGLTCTFSGNYQFGDKMVKTFPSQTIITREKCNLEGDSCGGPSNLPSGKPCCVGFDCQNFQCVKTATCSSGQTKCGIVGNINVNGDVYYTCVDGTFKSQGKVVGKCGYSQCQSGADSNNDGAISRSELGSYINKWIAGTKTRTTLGKSIMEWVGGCSGSSNGGNGGASCHTKPIGDYGYCTSSCKCAEGEGDCDGDTQCNTGLVCVNNVGARYGFASGLDICEKP